LSLSKKSLRGQSRERRDAWPTVLTSVTLLIKILRGVGGSSERRKREGDRQSTGKVGGGLWKRNVTESQGGRKEKANKKKKQDSTPGTSV